MAVLRSAALVAAMTILITGLILSRAPFLMPATAPSKPWADGPIRLMTTPQDETNKTDMFTSGATHMALLHNAIFRGYNSIYQQAPHVQSQDKADFVGYCLTWHKFVQSHHDDEEQNLFGRVEDMLDDTTVFAETHEEHAALLPGLAAFERYLRGLPSPAALDGGELVRIMAGFEAVFAHHFHHEIATLAALAAHEHAPPPGSAAAAAATATFKAWGKTTVSKAGVADVVPFFLLNLDGTAEGGRWARWPPMPAPVRWALVNVAGARHAGRWRFASCDARGRPRELYALAA